MLFSAFILNVKNDNASIDYTEGVYFSKDSVFKRAIEIAAEQNIEASIENFAPMREVKNSKFYFNYKHLTLEIVVAPINTDEKPFVLHNLFVRQMQ